MCASALRRYIRPAASETPSSIQHASSHQPASQARQPSISQSAQPASQPRAAAAARPTRSTDGARPARVPICCVPGHSLLVLIVPRLYLLDEAGIISRYDRGRDAARQRSCRAARRHGSPQHHDKREGRVDGVPWPPHRGTYDDTTVCAISTALCCVALSLADQSRMPRSRLRRKAASTPMPAKTHAVPSNQSTTTL